MVQKPVLVSSSELYNIIELGLPSGVLEWETNNSCSWSVTTLLWRGITGELSCRTSRWWVTFDFEATRLSIKGDLNESLELFGGPWSGVGGTGDSSCPLGSASGNPFWKTEAKDAIRQLLPQYIRIYILHTVPFTCPFSTGRENLLNNQSFLGYQSSPFFLTFLVNDSEVFL